MQSWQGQAESLTRMNDKIKKRGFCDETGLLLFTRTVHAATMQSFKNTHTILVEIPCILVPNNNIIHICFATLFSKSLQSTVDVHG